VRADADSRCGYCHSYEAFTGIPLDVEHIIPQAAGGPTIYENLWLACHRCNGYKGDRVDAVDPETGERHRLYNPRAQAWTEHFAWAPDGTEIAGLTACGRATLIALRLNNEFVVAARRFWVEVGRWPPAEDLLAK
jgi:hypothetical protein